MTTTRDLLKQVKAQKGQTIKICPDCLKRFTNFEYLSRMREDIKEVGIECPNCEAWFHSFFLNKDLDTNRPDSKAQRKEKREYKKRFQAFQKRTRKHFKMRKVNGRWLDKIS